MSPPRFSEALGAVAGNIIGLDREAEILAAALDTGRHVVLEGPPGTGKSSLLRVVCRAAGTGFVFVEGNAELTPNRLLGSHDPAMVLEGGYRPEAFVEGPLIRALREGSVLYLEEFNRIPEETLNVLITALEEGEAHVPRVGIVEAAPGFRLVAAMNPFDAVGTARISHAVSDRTCRIAIGYQDVPREREIVTLAHDGPPELVAFAVDLARATRDHPDVRVGSSVRGAIDLTLLAVQLGERRRVDPMSRATLRDAALAALSGRIRLDESSARSPDEVIDEIFDALWDGRSGEEASGKAEPPPSGRGLGRTLTGADAEQAIHDASKRRLRRSMIQRRNPAFGQVSPEVGEIDESALAELMAQDLDAAAALLADMAVAVDDRLRRLARRLASRTVVRLASEGGRRRQVHRLVPGRADSGGDVDLERTLDRTGGLRPSTHEDLVTRTWGSDKPWVVLLVDRSGSMSGAAVARAATAAAAILLAANQRAECGVIAFARDRVVLKPPGQPIEPHSLVDQILQLRGHGTTDIASALEEATRSLAAAPPGARRTVVLLSDCLATEGPDPTGAMSGFDVLHVVAPDDNPESVEQARRLTTPGGGLLKVAKSLADVARVVPDLLR